MEGLIPQAVASAIQSSQALRGGLPRDYLNYMGVVHSDEVNPRWIDHTTSFFSRKIWNPCKCLFEVEMVVYFGVSMYAFVCQGNICIAGFR